MAGLAGTWVGHITGTNAGRVAIRVSASGTSLDGTIELHDKEFGLSRFIFVGMQDGDRFRLKLSPHQSPEGVLTAPGSVTGRIQPDGTIAGVWETEIGTAGKFTARRSPLDEMKDPRPNQSEPATSPHRSSMTPLWVISLFVSLSEVVTGFAVTQATGSIQVALTVFVVTFPVLVGAAFFAILWKKPYVFYPPTEFGTPTNVSEYVRALGGLSPTQAEERQRQLIGSSVESGMPKATSTPGSAPSKLGPETEEAARRPELASNVLKFFAFQRMRYSDVSDATSRAVFNLGAYQGFNLFDGVPGIAFFGYFPGLDGAEIATRIRFLLDNIDLSYRRVKEYPDAAQREAALRILDQIRVEVLVPEDAPLEEIKSKVEEYRPEGSTVPLAIHKPSGIEWVVRREYESMGLGK